MSGGFEPTGSEKKGIRDVYMEKRLFDDDTTIISARAYNLIIGVMIALGFAIDFFMAYELSNLILRIPLPAVIIAYLIMSLGGTFVVHKSTSAFVSGVGFIVMAIGMGLLLTFFLNEYNLSAVYLSFGITAAITIIMMILGTIMPNLFLSIGKSLGIALLIAIIVEIVCSFFFRGALEVVDFVIIPIFCGYIGYDWARAQKYPKTANNAIDAAADLYIDIVNVLIRILEIVGDSKS